MKCDTNVLLGTKRYFRFLSVILPGDDIILKLDLINYMIESIPN